MFRGIIINNTTLLFKIRLGWSKDFRNEVGQDSVTNICSKQHFHVKSERAPCFFLLDNIGVLWAECCTGRTTSTNKNACLSLVFIKPNELTLILYNISLHASTQ